MDWDQLSTRHWLAAAGTAITLVLLFVPWYVANGSAKIGLASGFLGLLGSLCALVAGSLIVLVKMGKFDQKPAGLEGSQLALLAAILGAVLLLLRLLFRPGFDTFFGDVSLTAAPIIALCVCAGLAYLAFIICRDGAGLPFSGALTANSKPRQTTGAAGAAAVTSGGWFPDPSGTFDERFFDGAAWTGRVRRRGNEATDPNFQP